MKLPELVNWAASYALPESEKREELVIGNKAKDSMTHHSSFKVLYDWDTFF